MKKMRLVKLALLWSMLMTAALAPFMGANAAQNGDFVIEGGRLIKYTGSSSHVVIPDSVTVIGKDSFYTSGAQYDLNSVEIPSSVKTIESAFYGCKNLHTVSFSEGLERIEGTAFFNGPITALTLPGSLSYIGGYAFGGNAIASLTFTGSAQPMIIETYAFVNNDELTEVVIPGNVKRIGDSAFSLCDKLTEVVLEPGVEEIGAEAFQNCEVLAHITLPDGLKRIGDLAFHKSPLEELLIPDSVTSFGKLHLDGGNAYFPPCATLKKLHWPAGVPDIPDSEFDQYAALEKVEIPEG
ncbi:MAG: leucine-rich repeat domain-containing protein, partial [Clostridia bacterium]|nr:leucine-rich repeat domain-containing protein [Clostridia bacterium]